MNKYILIFIVIIILCIIIVNTKENYDSSMDLLNLSNERYIVKNIDNKEFEKVVNTIKEIIISMIMEYGMVCTDMNGKSESSMNRQLTLICNTDYNDIEDNIIKKILLWIDEYFKSNFKFGVRKLDCVRTLKKHLSLIETLINPLANSKIYTLNGVQYFTKNKLHNIVYANENIINVIYTVFLDNGINII